MKQSRRILSILISILLAFTLVSCSDKKDSETTDETKEQESEFIRGYVANSVYTNEFADLKIAIPNSWTVSEDASIGEAMGLTYDSENQEEFDSSVCTQSVIYDLIVTSNISYSSVLVLYNNLEVLSQTDLTPAEYLALYSDQIEAVEGAAYSFTETVFYEIAGYEYAVMDLSATASDGTEMNQRCYARRIDNFMITITATVSDGTDLDYFDALFR